MFTDVLDAHAYVIFNSNWNRWHFSFSTNSIFQNQFGYLFHFIEKTLLELFSLGKKYIFIQ